MKLNRRQLLASAGAGLATGLMPRLILAQEKVIKFGFPQDFTRVYTFLAVEYSQGQRDYLSLINARGGVQGWKIQAEVVDTGNEVQRGIEAYERFKRDGVILVDTLSTPVSRGLVSRVLADKINLITPFHGRSDAADGTVFPYVMPMTASYWSQAAILVDYMGRQEDLRGKKIAIVHIDTPFGKEPLPLLQDIAKRRGFELQAYPYAPPGNEQTAVWTQVRRARPDWTILWGAGVGQPVSMREAIRNGISPSRLASCVWLAEADMRTVGTDLAKGMLKYEGAASGTEPKVIQDIIKEVVDKGNGAGARELVGNTYYNIGVMAAALMVEGVRLGLEITKGAALTGETLNQGLRSIRNFTAENLGPPTNMSMTDHQGGGMGRVVQWDGSRWAPQSDWFAADQDLVWKMVREESAKFKAS